MTRNQIITQLFTGKNFNQCIDKMEPEHLREDLKMEVIAIVCEWSDDRIIGLHERRELDFFVVRVILNQVQSNTSPFYRKYRKAVEQYDEQAEGFWGAIGEGASLIRHKVNIVSQAVSPGPQAEAEQIEVRQRMEELEDRTIASIDSLNWYDAGLLRLYAIHGSYRAIQKATQIPYVSCYHTIQKSIKELKQKVLCSTGI